MVFHKLRSCLVLMNEWWTCVFEKEVVTKSYSPINFCFLFLNK